MSSAAANPVPLPPAAPRINLWPLGVIAAFVVFIFGTITLVMVAVTQRNDLVAGDYYEQELRYQSRIEHLQRTQPWATQVTAGFDPTTREILVALPPAQVAKGAQGKIEFYRPSAAIGDRTVPLAADATGHQRVPRDAMAMGLWKVRLSWKVGGEDFYAERDLLLPPSPADVGVR